MPRTMLRQDTQVQASASYAASSPPGAALQNSAVSSQDDLNSIRSQLSRIIDISLGGNWYDDLGAAPGTGAKRGVNQINSALASIETKPFLSRIYVPANIAVATGKNVVILSAASSQTPTQNIAIAPASLGAVVAQSSATGTAFEAWESSAVTGSGPQAPKNLIKIRDSQTGQAINASNDRDIMGLLQVESGATDSSAFSDTAGKRVKISFVVIDPATQNLVAAPASAIGGQSFQYNYINRATLGTLPEQAFISDGSQSDLTSDVDIHLTRATANQSGPVPVPRDLFWQIATGSAYKFQDSSGTKDLLSIAPAAGANAITVASDTLLFNTTSAPVSRKGVTVAQATQSINVGVSTGQIDSPGSLTLASTGSNPLALKAGAIMTFTDGDFSGSAWTSPGINLSSTTAEVNAYRTAMGGESSLMAGITKAFNHGTRIKRTVTVTQAIAAAANVTGAGAGANVSAQLPDYSSVAGTFPSSVDVFVNGELQCGGNTQADGNDVWPGNQPSLGDLKFANPLRATPYLPDVITVAFYPS